MADFDDLDDDAPATPKKRGMADDTPVRRTKVAELTATAVLLDYILFRRMITPIIIQFLFWATAIVIVCAGIYTIFDGIIPQDRAITTRSGLIGETVTTTYSGDKKSDLREAFGGLLLMVIGPVLLRIYCELLILFFRMNETLTDIRSSTARE